MADSPTLALIDASGYLYRAFHAIPGLSGPGGRPTNAVYGFANMLNKYRTARNPDAVAVCFDRHERTFRHDLDAGYKAQRMAMPDDLVPQIEDAKRLCKALGLSVVEEPGFEADDLIGALATRASSAGLRVEIASSDKDLLQLVRDDRVVVWHATKEKLLDAAGVREFFGVPPERVVDVLALMGDSSDNIPGVKGIGDKGARELVTAFGSLEDIYAHLDEVKGKRRECLANGREDAFRSRELATLRRDAPIGEALDDEAFLTRYRVRPPGDHSGYEDLCAFFDEMGFSKMKKDLVEARAFSSRGPDTESQSRSLDAGPSSRHAAYDAARWETSAEGLDDLVAAVRREGRAGISVELCPGRPFPPAPLVAVVALPEGETTAFPLGSAEGKSCLAALFAARDVVLLAHDAKRLFLAAAVLGIAPPSSFEDLMLSAYMVAPGLHAHDLAGDARAILELPPGTVPSVKDVWGSTGLDAAESFGSAPALQYLTPRARLPLELSSALEKKLGGPEGSALKRVLHEIELPLVPVLSRMEWTGIAVDREVLSELSTDFTKRLLALEQEIHNLAGEPFNIGSPAQLGRILFEKLGYPVVRKTSKTKSYSTDSEVLAELAARQPGPLPGLILEWRELSKLKGTYVDALPWHIAKDGRIHTRYDQAVAATGRLSSNDPNLQNIPIRTEAGRAIRRAFVAPAGRLLIAADYSQIELRLLAHLSGDEGLIEVFRSGQDIHRATAAKVFGIDPNLVSHDQRRGAKTINFGVLYGMGPFALAAQLGVSQSDAKAFIKAYFDRFPNIRICLDAILARARETGGTETIFGRTRPIPGLFDRNHAVRTNAERMAMNAPFQGSAADLIKRAMVALDANLGRDVPSARILLQVHDELVIECDEADVDEASRVVKETMEGAAALSVPLTVDVCRGRNWAEAK